MAGLKHSKRVSWATDGNLRKVRLFLSEDAPSQSGLGAQDHLQAKAAWLLHAGGLVGSDDSLPPGFEAPHKYQFRVEISQIPLINWQCPQRLVLNPEWLVVAGEESQEVAIESQRHLGVLEAIYPRSSSIPPNPSAPSEVQVTHIDDSHTPLIPITAIEDEDVMEQSDMVEASSDESVQLQSLPNGGTQQDIQTDQWFTVDQLQSQPNAVPPPVYNLPCANQPAAATAAVGASVAEAEPDIMAAASAAFTAIMRSSEEGSLVDRDLLIKILSNPSLLEKLVSEYGGASQQTPSQQPAPQVANPMSSSQPPPPQLGFSRPFTVPPISHTFTGPSMVTPPLFSPHPSPGIHMATISPALQQVNAPPVKDINYYKNLIHQHGGERQEALDQNPVQLGNVVNRPGYHNHTMGANSGGEGIGLVGLKQSDLKPKIPKPCVYFNTPRGCRKGAGCSYQHDATIRQRLQQPEGSTKRIKLDRGIAGRI